MEVKREQELNLNEKSEIKPHISVNKNIRFKNKKISNYQKKEGNKESVNFNSNNFSYNYSYINKDMNNNFDNNNSDKKNLRNMNINNYQFEIQEKEIIFKNSGEQKKQLFGNILSEFEQNKNLSNNIFDENNINYYNNIFNKENSENKNIQKVKENRIQEIQIKNLKLKKDNKINMYKKKKNFYISKCFSDLRIKKPMELKIEDRNDNINTEINFNNDNKINHQKNYSLNSNYLNTENLIESVRNRNRPKNIILNSFTYNDLFNKSNTLKDFHKTPKNFNRLNNINNINNINNNISLNNRYNFYIKIGKSNENNQKNCNNNNNNTNKKINYGISLKSPTNKNKGEISSKIIKNLIKDYEIDNVDNNNNYQKEIMVKTRPLFKKLEVQKSLNNNFINKESRNKKNKIDNNIKTQRVKNNMSHSFNKTNFKFLVHQAYENRNIRSSFNKYYKSNIPQKGRSQSNRNENNNPFNYQNLVNQTQVGQENNIDKINNSNTKYKSFYQSFKNIGLIKKDKKNSEIKNLKKINIKNIDIINYNMNINNINLKNNITKEKSNEINNKNSFHQSNTQRIIYNIDNSENVVNNRESYQQQSKVNSSFSSFSLNSNFNSFTSLTNINNNINTNTNTNNIILSSTSSIINNLSSVSINLEILYVLQEKLKLISEYIKTLKKCDKVSFEYINYYFSHDFSQEIIKLIKSSYNQSIILKNIKIELLCHFLLYDLSFEEEMKEIGILLKSIFNLLYKNLLISISFIISEFKNKNNNIIIILNKIINDNLKNDDLYDEYKNLDESKFITILESNYNKILDYYNMIIENIYMKKIDENNKIPFIDCINNINPRILSRNKYETIISNFFIQAHKNLNEISQESLKNFFYSFLNHKDSFTQNIKPKIKSNLLLNQNHYLLPKIKEHKYTLILDLDETLIYSQINFNYHNYNNKIFLPKATLILRPGLHEFLHDMKLLFELIIFSSGTPNYVDPIIKYIEKDEKYFDYVLYRKHMINDEKGESVKNLELLGRDLKNVIIIDDVAKNFRFQKDNGICIKPFTGNITNDLKTLKILNNALQKIIFDADQTKDIRISLKKFQHLLYPIVINDNE